MNTLFPEAARASQEGHDTVREQQSIDGRLSRLNCFQQYSDRLKILNLMNISETEYFSSLPQTLTQLTLKNCSINSIKQIQCKFIQFLTIINCNLNDIVGIEEFQQLKQANFQHNKITSLKGVMQHEKMLVFNIENNPIVHKFKKNDQLQIIAQSYFPNIKYFNNVKIYSLMHEPVFDFQHLLMFYGLDTVHYEQVSYTQQHSIKFMIDYQQDNLIKLELGTSNARVTGVYLVKFHAIDEDITDQFDVKTSSLVLNQQQMQTDQKLVAIIELNDQIILLAASRSSSIQLSDSKPHTFNRLKVQNYEQLRGKQIKFIQVLTDMVVSDKNDFTPFIQGFYKIYLTTVDDQLIQYQFYVNDLKDKQLIQNYLSNNAFSYIANYLGCDILCVNGRIHLTCVEQNFMQYLLDSDIRIEVVWKFLNKDIVKDEQGFNNQFVIKIPDKYINYNIQIIVTYFSINDKNILCSQTINIQDKIISQPKLVNYYRFIKEQHNMTQLQEDILNNTYQLIMYNSDMQANSVLELQVHQMLLFEQNIYKIKWFTSELNLFQIHNLYYFKNVYEDIKYYKKYKYQNDILTLSYEDPISGTFNDLQFRHQKQQQDTPYYRITDADVQKFILAFINYKYIYISHVPVMQDCKSVSNDLNQINITLSENTLLIRYSNPDNIQDDIQNSPSYDNDTIKSQNLLSKYSFSSNNLYLRQNDDNELEQGEVKIQLSKEKNVITYLCYDITVTIEYLILINNENIKIPVDYQNCQIPFKLSYRDMYETVKQVCNKFTQQIQLNICVSVRNKVFDVYSKKIDSFIIFNKEETQIQRFLQSAGIEYNNDIQNTNANNTIVQLYQQTKNTEKVTIGDCEYKMIFSIEDAVQPTFKVIINQLNINTSEIYCTGTMTVDSMVVVKNLSIDSALITGFTIPGVKQVETVSNVYQKYQQKISKIVKIQQGDFTTFNTNYLILKDKFLNRQLYFFIFDKLTGKFTVIMFNNFVTLRNTVDQICISSSQAEIKVAIRSKHNVQFKNSFIYFTQTQHKYVATSCQSVDQNESVIMFKTQHDEHPFDINLVFDKKLQFVLKDVSMMENIIQQERLSQNQKQNDQITRHNYVYIMMSPRINTEAAKFMQESHGPLQPLLEPNVMGDVFDNIDTSENVSVSIL